MYIFNIYVNIKALLTYMLIFSMKKFSAKFARF